MADNPTDPTVTMTEATAVVCPAGEVDLASAPRLATALANVLACPGVTTVVVDLAGVTFLDSSGLATLVTAWHDAQEAGVALRLTPTARPHVAQVLSITGVDELLRPVDG
jgi:anti-sigma B factor antagonist